MVQLKELILVSILMLAAPFLQGGLSAAKDEEAQDVLPERRVELTPMMAIGPNRTAFAARRVSSRSDTSKQSFEAALAASCEPIITALPEPPRLTSTAQDVSTPNEVGYR